MSGSLQAFQVPAAAASAGTVKAALACGKRCTYGPLGNPAPLNPKAVTVVGFSFETLGRAVEVSVGIKRGRWARWRGVEPVQLTAAPRQGVVHLLQPFQVGISVTCLGWSSSVIDRRLRH
jgi:hypothetical protein